MLTCRVIPCLDTSAGRVVKGRQFVALRDVGPPAELARRYDEEGADEVVLLDIAATPGNRSNATATVRAVRRVLRIPLTVGGGVRSVSDARRLLASGADKVAVNSAAAARPELLRELADEFGRQCVTIAIDALRNKEGQWSVRVRSGTASTTLDAVQWAADAAALGAGEILLTSIDRDGTGDGYDAELIAAVRGVVTVPVVASGGARTTADMVIAMQAGADAVLAASVFHDRTMSIAEAKDALRAAGVAVRQ